MFSRVGFRGWQLKLLKYSRWILTKVIWVYETYLQANYKPGYNIFVRLHLHQPLREVHHEARGLKAAALELYLSHWAILMQRHKKLIKFEFRIEKKSKIDWQHNKECLNKRRLNRGQEGKNRKHFHTSK